LKVNRQYTSADFQLIPWPSGQRQPDGTIRTSWRLELSRSVVEGDVLALQEHLIERDQSLRLTIARLGPKIIRLDFTWTEYGADELSRSAVAIGEVESVTGELASIEGWRRSAWPISR
jgi:hypothetical protein